MMYYLCVTRTQTHTHTHTPPPRPQVRVGSRRARQGGCRQVRAGRTGAGAGQRAALSRADGQLDPRRGLPPGSLPRPPSAKTIIRGLPSAKTIRPLAPRSGDGRGAARRPLGRRGGGLGWAGGADDLSAYRGLAACGGFSYGDVLGAGGGWGGRAAMVVKDRVAGSKAKGGGAGRPRPSVTRKSITDRGKGLLGLILLVSRDSSLYYAILRLLTIPPDTSDTGLHLARRGGQAR